MNYPGPSITPFWHRVLDDWITAEEMAILQHEWPGPTWAHWLTYHSPLERKRTCKEWQAFPPECKRLLLRLLLLPVADLYGQPLLPDPLLWGAGMQEMGQGDHLDLHLDSDTHPVYGVQRRLNAILFVHPRWEQEWGGQLELWADPTTTPTVCIDPRPGRLVLFETSDHSYHGVPHPLTCPATHSRRTLTVFWWGGVPFQGQRPRALFLPTPGQQEPAGKQHLRLERARSGCAGKGVFLS